MKAILDEEKARAMLLGRRSSGPAATNNAPQNVPTPPPQPTSKSNPLTRKNETKASSVPAPPPPPPAPAKTTKVHNQALEQLLTEPIETSSKDVVDGKDLDNMNMDINFEEIEDFKLVKEALLQGVDLRQYSLQIESSLSQVDKESVSDYFSERDNFVKLYYQLNDVDGVLGKFEELLSNFQRDLRSISSEIRNLQTQTMSMNMKLRNRKNVEEKTAKFVEDISITQDLRDHITKDDINEAFLKYLIFLDKKVSLSQTYKSKGALAVVDTEGHQQKLLYKAVGRVQKYLFSALVGFRTFAERKTRQQELVPLGYLFQFLFKHSSLSANELVSSYVDSCNTFFTNFYKNYAYAFDRTKDADATRTEYLTSSSNKLKNVANFIATKVHIGNTASNKNVQGTFFALGSRPDIFAHLDQPPQEAPAHNNLLVNIATGNLNPASASLSSFTQSLSLSSTSSPSLVQSNSSSNLSSTVSQDLSGASANTGASSTKHPYEVIFKNIMLQLMDLVAAEHKFVVDFFLAGDDVSFAIFGRSINILTESLTNYLTNTSDIVGMLLVLCIIHKYAKVMTERRVGVLDTVFQKLSNLVVAHIMRVMNENQETLKQATMKELKPIDIAPHILTRRYADLLASVSVLLPQIPEEVTRNISNSFKQLRMETDKLIQKMADEISDSKSKTAFLIANYGYIATVAQDRGIPITDPITGPARKVFERSSSQYIDDQTNSFKYFVSMINFSKEWGPLVESGVRIDETSNPKFNKDAVETILRDFDVNWKLGMEDIKKNIRKSWGQSPVTSAQMLELVLEYLHSHYKQITGIVNKNFKQLKTSSFFRPDQVMSDMRAMAAM